MKEQNLVALFKMFFSRNIFKQAQLTPAEICESLSLPRIEYGEALFEWHQEISKSTPDENCRPPPGFEEPQQSPAPVKTGYYVHSLDKGLELIIPTESEPLRDTLRHKIIDKKILNCLRDGPMDTVSIGKRVLGRTPWRRPISALLYRMASEGTIIHHQEGDLHIWELTATEPISPIIVPPLPATASA